MLFYFFSSLSSLCILSLIIQRSTLFPYTTLFRSDRAGCGKTALCDQPSGRPCADGAADGRALISLSDAARFRRPYAADPGADRKSTRLNSSHLVISYAVFCLKKKKRNSTNR